MEEGEQAGSMRGQAFIRPQRECADRHSSIKFERHGTSRLVINIRQMPCICTRETICAVAASFAHTASMLFENFWISHQKYLIGALLRRITP